MERRFIPFAAKVVPVGKINSEFTLCKTYICALGKNRNFSHIGKDAAEKAQSSLYNIPVIGHIYKGDDGKMHMGSHDRELAKDDNGNYYFKSLCVPYGVVPQQGGIRYEDIVEPNGDVKTYIVGQCILWTGRYPELEETIYSEDGTMFAQSMEINVDKYEPLEEDKNYTNILEYEYSALCLLGKSDNPEYDVTPCFPSARVDAYELDDTGSEFVELFSKMKESLSECFSKNSGKEEEVKMENEETKVMAAEEPVVETCACGDKKEDDMACGDKKEDDMACGDKKEDDMACGDSKKEEDMGCGGCGDKEEKEECGKCGDEDKKKCELEESKVENTFGVRDIFEALRKVMPCSEDVWYEVCDFDEKFVYVERCIWKECGCEEQHGRFEFTYDKEAKVATLNGDFVEMFVHWLTADEEAALNAMRANYSELVDYKNTREKLDYEAEIDEAIKEFSDLSSNEEFQKISENRYSFKTVEDLKNACYIIRGKFSLIAPAHKAASEVTVPIANTTKPLTARERLHEQYGKR